MPTSVRRWRGLIAVALATSLALTLVACTDPDEPAEEADGTSPTTGALALTVDDDGTTVTIAQDQRITVTLESNPSTGYSWEAVDLDLLEQVGDAEFTSDVTDPEIVGAGGTETLTFEPTGTGTTTLRLVYHRPWEDVDPIETFEVTVVIE